MRIIGLTGGIGSGKSTVARYFVELGVPVYNSDENAKKLMVRSDEVKSQIIALLGDDAYIGETLNKKYIAQQIFNNEALLRKMNGIVHPAVQEDFLAWVEKQTAPYVIQETALIFENSKEYFYDAIILVTAPINTRVLRVMKRDEASKKEVLDRLENQLSDTYKLPFSDYIIENMDLKKTRGRVEEINTALLFEKC